MNIISADRIWRLFHQVLTPGECLDFSNLLKGISHAELDSVFDDYLVPGLSLAKGANAPDLEELRDGLFENAFAGTLTVVEQAFFSVHILHGIKAGTTPTFHIHWAHNNATPSGDVKWSIDYSVAKGYGAGTFAAPTTVTTTQTAPAQYVHQITDDDDMPINVTDLEPDSLLLGRVYRDPDDAADTFADDAFFLELDIHYERDKIGTLDRNRPYDGF
jgi:hypothetical protein